MKSNTTSQIDPQKPVTREAVISVLRHALGVEEYRFARRVAAHWLGKYSGDLPVSVLQAQALLGDLHTQEAISVLKQVVSLDPEFLDAHRLLAQAAETSHLTPNAEVIACIAALSGEVTTGQKPPDWGLALYQSNRAISEGDLKQSEGLIQQALLQDPISPLPAVFHLKVALKHYEWIAVQHLVDMYQQRWQDCLVFKLAQAHLWMESGEEDQAVAQLHQCVALDLTGQVPLRLWGANHPYATLWPKGLAISLDLPIPAAVAAALGWNQLPRGETYQAPQSAPEEPKPQPEMSKEKLPRVMKAEPQLELSPEMSQEKSPRDIEPDKRHRKRAASQPETLISVQSELQQVASALQQPQIARADGRFPVYVVLTTLEGLAKQYGDHSLSLIDEAMRRVVKSTQNWGRWRAALVYADDGKSVDQFGIQPAKPFDPWSIKKLLADLDGALHRRGEMIGALLIVGGPEVVPFHRLPNPVDDDDADVPSDNPYATCDENYFIPHWPVGRVSGGKDSDPATLLHNLWTISKNRGQKSQPKRQLRDWLGYIFRFFKRKRRLHPSFGYSAEIWQRASHSVFRPIGEPRRLAISPPLAAEQLNKKVLQPVHLGYFNLHGLEDAPEWFGQRDPIETPDGPDYPVALRPKDVVNGGRAPQVVFSEACYGAHITGKTNESALSLRFLASGSRAVVGSTCTSYGSITTPLIAADLLGHAFWKFLQEGYPVGEALRRAKIHLAREMHRRQGYLDGEDQKTLISFILLGDPLTRPVINGHAPKNILRERSGTYEPKTVCDRHNGLLPLEQDVPKEVLAQVKKVVKAYLPGMEDAALIYSHEHTECQGHECPTVHLSAHAVKSKLTPNRRLVTLSKQTRHGDCQHPRYARITMDKQGKVVKLAVSR